MTIFFLSLILPFAAEAATLKKIQLPEALRKIEAQCVAIDGGDAFACPAFKAYQVKGEIDLTRTREVQKLFAGNGDDGGVEYMLRNYRASEAAKLITQRLADQVENLKGLNPRSSYSQARSVHLALERYVAGWQQLIYGDDDTYWAPSVNASALLLVNPKTKVVIEILHGDTDG